MNSNRVLTDHMRDVLSCAVGILYPLYPNTEKLIISHVWRNVDYLGVADGKVVIWRGWSANLSTIEPNRHVLFIDTVQNSLSVPERKRLFGDNFTDAIDGMDNFVVMYVGGLSPNSATTIRQMGHVERVMGRTIHACCVSEATYFVKQSEFHWAAILARSDARLREEFGLAGALPKVWLALDEAHQFAPSSSNALGKQQLIRWAKEGRQPGLSLVVATQQPSAIDREVLSQCDVILSHKLTTRDDVMALNSLSQDYMGGELRNLITDIERTGQAILVDDERESVSKLQIRPRQSQHGGGTSASDAKDDYDIWQQ